MEEIGMGGETRALTPREHAALVEALDPQATAPAAGSGRGPAARRAAARRRGAATGAGSAEAEASSRLAPETSSRAPFKAPFRAQNRSRPEAARPGVSVGYLFRFAPDAPQDPDMGRRLEALAQAMAEDEPEPARALSDQPAFLFVLAQFLEHDLFCAQDPGPPLRHADPLHPRRREEVEGALVNRRSGALRLESLQGVDAGRGPLAEKLARLSREPGAPARMRLDLAAPVEGLARPATPMDGGADLLRLGRLLQGAGGRTLAAELRALPPELRGDLLGRGAPNPAAALIGDRRNDANLPLAQLHVAMLRFQNRMADWLADQGRTPPEALRRETRRLCAWHLQWLVLNRYLPALCDPRMLALTRRAGAPVYAEFRNALREAGGQGLPAPLEFWAGAGRIGPTMTPAAFAHNARHPQASLGLLTAATGGRMRAALGRERLPADLAIDWRLYLDPAANAARRIDTNIAPDDRHAGVFRDIALRALRRGRRLNLPSAQACIAELNAIYTDAIRPLPREALTGGHTGEAIRDGLDEATPLWFYVLKEAEVQQEGARLGQLGSLLMAETLVGAIACDPESIWRKRGASGLAWSPADGARPDGADIDEFEGLLCAAEVI